MSTVVYCSASNISYMYQCNYEPVQKVIYELHSSDKIGRQGKNYQQTSSKSGPTLHHGDSAARVIDPGRDPSSL